MVVANVAEAEVRVVVCVDDGDATLGAGEDAVAVHLTHSVGGNDVPAVSGT